VVDNWAPRPHTLPRDRGFELWQAVANELPPGDILIVLPEAAKPQYIAETVAAQLRAEGKHVSVIDNGLQVNAL
jgi:hypothetical protein